MSTKIYDVYKVDGLSMPEIMECLYELKSQYINVCLDFLVRLGYDYIMSEYETETNFSRELKRQAESMENNIFSWSASAVLYFHEDNVYIQFFGLSRTINYMAIFKNRLIDYHYQNQSDPWYCFENDMTEEETREAEKEYEERERVWDEIMGDRYKFCESGLTYEIYGPGDTFQLVFDWYQKVKGSNEDG